MRFFHPILTGGSFGGRALACLGAAIGIGLTIVVCASFPHAGQDLPFIVAPLGASAVLVFAVPSSPMAQPWSVVGGNVISSLVGITVFQLVPDATWASGIAVGGAILAMSLLRCLHPPGGAAALTAVIGSESIHLAGYAFAFAPVAINSITLVTVAMMFHRISGHSYPHQPAEAVPMPKTGVQFADIDAALEDMHESFDIDRKDLDALLSRAKLHAAERAASAP